MDLDLSLNNPINNPIIDPELLKLYRINALLYDLKNLSAERRNISVSLDISYEEFQALRDRFKDLLRQEKEKVLELASLIRDFIKG